MLRGLGAEPVQNQSQVLRQGPVEPPVDWGNYDGDPESIMELYER